MIIVFVLSTINSKTEWCVHVLPERSALVGSPERNALCTPSLPMDQTTDKFVETIGQELSRTDWEWFPDPYPSSFFGIIVLSQRGYHTRISMNTTEELK